MKGYILKCTDTGAILKGNGIGQWLVFDHRSVADNEAEYLNHKCSSAPLRDRYVVEQITLD
jgi:hypothetical protein